MNVVHSWNSCKRSGESCASPHSDVLFCVRVWRDHDHCVLLQEARLCVAEQAAT